MLSEGGKGVWAGRKSRAREAEIIKCQFFEKREGQEQAFENGPLELTELQELTEIAFPSTPTDLIYLPYCYPRIINGRL